MPPARRPSRLAPGHRRLREPPATCTHKSLNNSNKEEPARPAAGAADQPPWNFEVVGGAERPSAPKSAVLAVRELISSYKKFANTPKTTQHKCQSSPLTSQGSEARAAALEAYMYFITIAVLQRGQPERASTQGSSEAAANPPAVGVRVTSRTVSPSQALTRQIPTVCIVATVQTRQG